ncbi:MAG: hypothetical protein ACJ786_03880, partial [Catenulispora sp.]
GGSLARLAVRHIFIRPLIARLDVTLGGGRVGTLGFGGWSTEGGFDACVDEVRLQEASRPPSSAGLPGRR